MTNIMSIHVKIAFLTNAATAANLAEAFKLRPGEQRILKHDLLSSSIRATNTVGREFCTGDLELQVVH